MLALALRARMLRTAVQERVRTYCLCRRPQTERACVKELTAGGSALPAHGLHGNVSHFLTPLLAPTRARMAHFCQQLHYCETAGFFKEMINRARNKNAQQAHWCCHFVQPALIAFQVSSIRVFLKYPLVHYMHVRNHSAPLMCFLAL